MALSTLIKSLIGAAIGLLVGLVLVNPIANEVIKLNANVSAAGKSMAKLLPTLFIVGLMIIAVNIAI